MDDYTVTVDDCLQRHIAKQIFKSKIKMIEFFFSNLEHFCLLFVCIAQMVLSLPRWDLILPRIPPSTRLLYSAITHPSRGHPKAHPKHFLSWPELESGQNELLSGQFGPQLGKMFEKGAKLF